MINRTAALSAFLAACFLVTSQASANQSDIHNAATAAKVSAEHAIKARVKAFEHAKVSMDDAISTVEGAKGGIIISAAFEIHAGKPAYKVRTYQNNSIWEGMVDAQTGSLIGSGKTTVKSQLDSRDKARLAGLSQAYTTFAEAVVMAEDREAGKAIGASLEEAQGKAVIDVMVVKNAAVKTMVFDAASGRTFS